MPFGFGRGRGGGGSRGGRRGMGRGGGRGRRQGLMTGAPGNCVCPSCNTIVPHHPGIPCYQTKCPKCEAPMTRQFDISGAGAEAESESEPDPEPAAQTLVALPVVEPVLCIGCEKCLMACPFGSIEMVGNKAVIHPELCSNCRICVAACPVNAIN